MAKDSFGVSAVHKALPFTVDTFAWNDVEKPQFVTHAHKDHAVDIEKYAAELWCTATTNKLLLIRFPCLARARTTVHILEMPNPQDPDFREALEDHEAQQVTTPSGETFSVMAIPSQHCDGAAMLLFEGAFGRTLHTGDARLDERYLALLPAPALAPDLLYLDCTFGEAQLDFPSRSEALRQVQALIQQHGAGRRVYISAETLGCEAVLRYISDRFGDAKMYLEPGSSTSFAWLGPGKQAERVKELDLLCPGLRTADPTATRFHICGSRELQNHVSKARKAARHRGQPEPLFIRPSTQKWVMTAAEEVELTGKSSKGGKCTTCLRTPTAPFQENGVWYVLWSMHGSQSELRHALLDIRPCAVQPICGKMAGPLAQLANSGNLAAANARIEAYAAQAAAEWAAATNAAATAAAATSTAVTPMRNNASHAVTLTESTDAAPQQQHLVQKEAAPEQDVECVLRHAEPSQAGGRGSHSWAERSAVHVSAVACTASTTASSPIVTALRYEPLCGSSQQLQTAARHSDISTQSESTQCDSEVTATAKHQPREDDSTAHVPTWAAPDCPSWPASRISAAATGKENAWISPQLKRSATAADCAAVPCPVRRAFTVSAAKGSHSEPALLPLREPAVSALDSINMSDAYINLDCLD